MTPKKFSIIIPVKPGGRVRAIEALHRADYPDDAFEILVAEGTCPSRQRNLAAGEAAGEILFFLDDDSMTDPGFLRRTAGIFEDDSVAAVGGPSLTPESDPPLRQAFGMALASIFGGGGVRNRYRRSGSLRETGDHELILCNLAMDASAFRDAGGFDERLYPNEENELLVRLKRKGLKLMHDPGLAVHRSQRPTFRAFMRQLFGYGRGRAQQILLGGGCGITTFIPVLFLVYLLSLPFVHLPVYYLPLLCYLVTGLCVALAAAFRTGKGSAALILPAVIPALHLCYGAGLIRGFAGYWASRKTCTASEIAIRRVKRFDSGGDWRSRIEARGVRNEDRG